MKKYNVKLKDHYNGDQYFEESEFSTIKECREWAKGKVFGLKYTVEIYRNDNNELHTTYEGR